MTNKEKRLKNKPWISNKILNKIKHRNSLFVRKKKDPNNEHIKSAYNKFRNSVNNDIKTSKKEYFNKYFENCKSNMKKTWKGINDLIRSNNKSTHINQINYNNKLINDPKDMSNAFNNFFASVGPSTDKDIPKTPISPLSFLRNRVLNNFSFRKTKIAEVMTIVLQLTKPNLQGLLMFP